MPIIGTSGSQNTKSFLKPNPPTIGTATDVGTGRAYDNGAATVTFTPAATGAAATSFTVTSSPGGFTATGASSPLVVQGLQSGVSYTFTATGTNAKGTSNSSAASSAVTATTVPGMPEVYSSYPMEGDTSITYSCYPPQNGGKTLSSGTLYLSGTASGTYSIDATSYEDKIISGLAYGNYEAYTVYSNANGQSVVSYTAYTTLTAPPVINYLISDASGTVSRSSDLSSATAISDFPNTNTYRSVNMFYRNSKFYVSDGYGLGGYSTDGYAWTTYNRDAFNNTNIVYGNSQYIAKGDGNIYSSTDFITWTTRYTDASIENPANSLQRPFYVGGQWIVPNPGLPTVQTSTNGVTWSKTTVTGPSMPAKRYWRNVYLGSYFYALGTSYTSSGLVSRSTDGVTWTNLTYPIASQYAQFFGNGISAANGRLFVTSGPGYTSTDGTTWTELSVPSTYTGSLIDSTDVVYGNSRWAVGYVYYDENYNLLNGFMTSTNGTTFTQASTKSWANAAQTQGLVYGTKYVAFANYTDYNGAGTAYAYISTSTDAVTWTSNVTLSRSSYNGYSRIFYTNSVYAMSTSASDDLNKVIAYSANGTSWSQAAGPTNVSNGQIMGAANNTFIWAGLSSIIHTSTNATTWTQRSVQVSGYWSTWSYGNGRYLSTDNNNGISVVTSTNLTTWSSTGFSGTQMPKSGVNFHGASNGTNLAVLVPGQGSYGSYDPIYYSTNGVTWSTSNITSDGQGGNEYISAPVYGNGVFLFSAYYGNSGEKLRRSTNGSTWTKASMPINLETINNGWNLEFDGAYFRAIGTNSDYSGYLLAKSTDGLTWTSLGTITLWPPIGGFMSPNTSNSFIGKPGL